MRLMVCRRLLNVISAATRSIKSLPPRHRITILGFFGRTSASSRRGASEVDNPIVPVFTIDFPERRERTDTISLPDVAPSPATRLSPKATIVLPDEGKLRMVVGSAAGSSTLTSLLVAKSVLSQ